MRCLEIIEIAGLLHLAGYEVVVFSVMDRGKPKGNNEFQLFTVGINCHILRMERQTPFDARPHVLKARKRCRYPTTRC